MNPLLREKVLATLREELQAMKEQINLQGFGEASRFKDDLGLDSLDIVEFVARAERRYRVHVVDDDFAALDTVGKVIDYVLVRAAQGKTA